MTDWLHNLDWAVAMRSDLLTPVFKAFSALGYGGFYLLFIPIGYWALNKRAFTRMTLLLMISSLLNAWLKDFFQDPRPDPAFQLDPAVGQSFGFPSGHSQMAVTTWFWLAWELRKNWAWLLSAVLVAGICFSRLYLGVHDLEDVLGGIGIGIGIVLLGIFIFLNSDRFQWEKTLHPLWQLAIIAIIEAVFFLTWPGELPSAAAGYGLFLLGFWMGVIMDRRQLLYKKHDCPLRVFWAVILGIVVFALLAMGFSSASRALADLKPLIRIVQPLFLGVYISALAPWALKRLKLATVETVGEKGGL